MPTIGLIGLGNAGWPIGERILARGYTLTVYDLNPTTVEKMVGRGARPCCLCQGGRFGHHAYSAAVIYRSAPGCLRRRWSI